MIEIVDTKRLLWQDSQQMRAMQHISRSKSAHMPIELIRQLSSVLLLGHAFTFRSVLSLLSPVRPPLASSAMLP